MKKLQKILAGVLSAAMLMTVIPAPRAESSEDIRSEINGLKEQYTAIQDKKYQLYLQQDANWTSIEEMVAYKNNLDEQMFLLYSEIQNLEEQITGYTTLIVETQQKLDEAQADLDELNEKYKERVRAMEEEGDVTYWSVLFKANSFTDLIDRLNMVREIAEADQRMLDKLEAAAKEVAETKEQLQTEKAGLEESRSSKLQAQEDLAAKREEADQLLADLNENQQALAALQGEYDQQDAQIAAQIAQAEKEFTAKQKEEEEQRRQQEQAAAGEESGDESGDESEDESGDEPTQDPPSGSTSDNGWLQPCSYIMISSSYGYRSGGWHNGVDFAANRGTPIYASRSGTVTTAKSLTYSYGNYVVINHGDGYSSLYAHMDYYVVSSGDYVTQGQLIGYVGSTGNSTGNHLHFTIFYDGSDVNPMNYL